VVPDSQVISGPGEYEVKGIEITGYQMQKESTKDTIKSVFLIKVEDLRLGFLGYIAETPDADALERLGEVDVLFVPAGGAPYLSAEQAAKLVKQINPKIVVATLFKIPKLARKAGDVKEFLSELELKAEPQEKLVVKQKDLPQHLTVHVPTI
jgi:L-ascorbate metabolism protein UlaG (beta-lactamase superfamily)